MRSLTETHVIHFHWCLRERERDPNKHFYQIIQLNTIFFFYGISFTSHICTLLLSSARKDSEVTLDANKYMSLVRVLTKHGRVEGKFIT